MLYYDSREFHDTLGPDRFPTEALGREFWYGVEPSENSLRALYERLCAFQPVAPPRPTIFISHRRSDSAQALRLAWLAYSAGFGYWLDVLDPTLSTLNSAPASAAASLAIASLIETALLNCSHVLVAMTPNTKGSLWVPYELGRAKSRSVSSTQAAAWIGSLADPADVPEYLHLIQLHKDELAISAWLAAEKSACAGFGYFGTPSLWTLPVPSPLP